MTTEKLQELMQARMAYFGEHLSDERVTAQLKAYAANLGTVPDDIAEQAFLIALAKCKCLNYFLRDWTTAVRDIQLDASRVPGTDVGKCTGHGTQYARGLGNGLHRLYGRGRNSPRRR